jgi:hypothetical protein
MERCFGVLRKQIDPDWIITSAESRTSEVIGIYSSTEPVALSKPKFEANS